MSLIAECDLDLLKQYIAESHSIKELQIKIGYSPNSGVTKTIMDYCNEHKLSLDHFTHQATEIIERSEENIFIENSTAAQSTLRRWYIKGQYSEYKCAICGQEPFWNGKELTLTLDHINGINTDDRLENLRWVCPNCDRQLDTFGSKNNRKIRINQAQKIFCVDCGKEISHGAERCADCAKKQSRVAERPEATELKQILLDNHGNFTRVGKIFGVSDNAIRKWCKAYDLPYHTTDYKS